MAAAHRKLTRWELTCMRTEELPMLPDETRKRDLGQAPRHCQGTLEPDPVSLALHQHEKT